ncbi:MAG: NUDIX domain-containing protein [Bacteroidia bacterium]
MKTAVTCGVYLYSIRLKKILACHATRSPWNAWSIPKGLKEETEDAYQSALRELEEETGIDPDALSVLELHRFPSVKYKKQNKILESFLILTDAVYETGQLSCSTLVNNSFPEIDKWKWISPETEASLLHESQQTHLPEIIKLANAYTDKEAG